MTTNAPDLIALSESDQVIARGGEDIRGRTVVDAKGEEVGTVDDLLIDTDDPKVRYVVVASGGFLGFGKQELYIPVSVIAGVDEVVTVDFGQTRKTAQPYDPPLVKDPGYARSVSGFYGFPPFWGAGYVPPRFPYHRG